MPLVNVDMRCTGNGPPEGGPYPGRVRLQPDRQKTELVLSQRPMSDAVPASTLWDIPVCYKRDLNGKTQPAACMLLSARTHSLTLDGCSSWVFANVDSRGYYRTAYDPRNVQALGEAVRTNRLTPLEQTTLLEDLWTLIQRDERSIADFLSFSSQLVKGGLSPAISTALWRINYLSEWIVDEPLRPAFQQWARETVRPLMDRLGWTPRPGESEDIQSLRSAVIFTMGNAGRDPEVLREAQRLARLHVTGASPLHSSLLDTTLEIGAIAGDATLYDQYRAYMAAGAAEQLPALAGLGFFEDPNLIARTLAYATSTDIRTQDAPSLIRLLMQRPAASAVTWAHLKGNWERIQGSFGIFQGVPRVIEGLQHVCDTASKRDVEQFFAANPVAGATRALQQSLESIDRCAAFKGAQSKNLAGFLSAR
jgi:aminopeptidase N